MTYRQRREARADRLREWAEKREAKAAAAFGQANTMADAIPFGQPMLVDHHSYGRDRRYRDRIGATMDRAIEHERMAESMASRATTIEHQLDVSIYSDDDDACERLRERIAGLEAERDRIKAYNATARKGAPDVSILTEREREGLALAWRHSAAYMERRKGQMPAYVLSNLGGRITKDRQRLASLERSADASPR